MKIFSPIRAVTSIEIILSSQMIARTEVYLRSFHSYLFPQSRVRYDTLLYSGSQYNPGVSIYFAGDVFFLVRRLFSIRFGISG